MHSAPRDYSQHWTSVVRSAIKTSRELSAFLDHPVPHLQYPLFLPLPLLEKIKQSGPGSALWLQFIPHQSEQTVSGGLFDPIADEKHSPVPLIVHRYKKKCLFLPTTKCPVICRYCFRKNELSQQGALFQPDFEKAFHYIEGHPEIEEVIFSGGDPFMLSTEKLKSLIERLRQITHIRYIRFHTRYPMIIPQRFDAETLNWLAKINLEFERVTLVTHLNHASELDDEIRKTFMALSDTKIALLSQSVLLKGVNDTVEDLVELFQAIAKTPVNPYYLHHPDNTLGGQHFCVELSRGAQLYQEMKKDLPGWAIPKYVVEQQDGRGKIDVLSLTTSAKNQN